MQPFHGAKLAQRKQQWKIPQIHIAVRAFERNAIVSPTAGDTSNPKPSPALSAQYSPPSLHLDTESPIVTTRANTCAQHEKHPNGLILGTKVVTIANSANPESMP